MGRLKKNDVEGHKRIEEIKKKCAEIGINYECYMQRRRHGWSEEEALIAPWIDVKQAFYLYKGVSVRKYLKEHGGNYNTFIYHVKRCSIEEAVEKTIKKQGNRKYMVDGLTLPQWCELYGKNYNNEYKKLKRRLDKERKLKYNQ